MNEINKYNLDYSKNYFWTKRDPITNRLRYYFNLNNNLVEVSKEVHSTCYNSYRKDINYNKQNQKYCLTSMDSENSEGITYHDLLQDRKSNNSPLHSIIEKIEEIVSRFDEIDQMIFYKCIYGDFSEKEISHKLNISQQAISKRKKKICLKIQEQLPDLKYFYS